MCVCLFVCVSVHICDILLLLHLQAIYFLKPYHLVMTMTKTKTYKKTETKTKTQTDKDKYKVLTRPKICYFFSKAGVQGFKILYWLSSCDDKDKEYFLGVNTFQR